MKSTALFMAKNVVLLLAIYKVLTIQYDAPNAVEELKQPRHPTPEKEEAIKDALKYFEII